MANKSKLILGLLGAAAAGVVVGLLLAPDKGTQTRKRIRDTTTDWAGHLSDLFGTAKSELENWRKKGTNAASDASNTFSNVRESYS